MLWLSDIVYKPKETKFLKSFLKIKKGLWNFNVDRTSGIHCFKAWFGFVPKSLIMA